MFIAILTLFAAGLAFWAASHISREIRRGRNWPTAPGAILERGVGEPMGRGRAHLFHVKYRYTVNGNEHVNDQVYQIRRTGGLPDRIRRIVNELPDPVPVHYNPQNPGESYLLASSRGTVWLLGVFGAGALVLGLLRLLVVVMPK